MSYLWAPAILALSILATGCGGGKTSSGGDDDLATLILLEKAPQDAEEGLELSYRKDRSVYPLYHGFVCRYQSHAAVNIVFYLSGVRLFFRIRISH